MHDMVAAIKIIQNEKPLLIFSIPAKELIDISYFNPRELDREKGLQREFKPTRSKDIANYINSEEAVLANDIIINLELDRYGLGLDEVYDDKSGQLNLAILRKATQEESNGKKISFVIDGQHRLRAFSFTKTEKKNFPLIVVALINLSLAEVAELFVKINYYQKPVNKSLVFDLLGISERIFPQYYVLHNVVKLLNEDIASPFYGRIKMLGLGKGYISQATLVTAIEKYKIEKVLEENGINPEEKVLYNVIWNFFKAVEETFSTYWGETKFLSKTVGIRALFAVLSKVLKKAIEEHKKFSVEYVNSVLKNIDQSIFEKPGITEMGGEKGVRSLSIEMTRGLGKDYE